MKTRIGGGLLLLSLSLGCSPSTQPGSRVSTPVRAPSSQAAELPKLPAQFRGSAGASLSERRIALLSGRGGLALPAGPLTAGSEPNSLTVMLDPELPLQLQPLAQPSTQPEPPPRCDLPDQALPHGIYRDDARTPGEVALTFDDGPHISHTPRVLKLLAERNLQATFFVVGRNIRSNTYHLLQEMVSAGHTLGSHSYNHDVDMSFRDYGSRTVEYIQGQHETTQILIDLALVAQSEQDFRDMYQRVFSSSEARYLSGGELRSEWPTWQARHFELLSERGFPGVTRDGDSGRPYAVVYSRPPGGGPYLGSPLNLRRLNDQALGRAGLLNVLWHDGAGDTEPERRNDMNALYANLMRSAKRGGVVLIHDFIRKDALTRALDSIQASPDLHVVSLDSLMLAKYGCTAPELRSTLKAARDAAASR